MLCYGHHHFFTLCVTMFVTLVHWQVKIVNRFSNTFIPACSVRSVLIALIHDSMFVSWLSIICVVNLGQDYSVQSSFKWIIILKSSLKKLLILCTPPVMIGLFRLYSISVSNKFMQWKQRSAIPSSFQQLFWNVYEKCILCHWSFLFLLC